MDEASWVMSQHGIGSVNFLYNACHFHGSSRPQWSLSYQVFLQKGVPAFAMLDLVHSLHALWWEIDWLIDCLLACLLACLVGWLVGWLVVWLVDGWIDWLTDWVIGWWPWRWQGWWWYAAMMVVVLVMVITITHKVHVLVTNSGGNRPLRNLKRVPPSRVAQGKPHVAFYIAVACDSHEVIHYLYTFILYISYHSYFIVLYFF